MKKIAKVYDRLEEYILVFSLIVTVVLIFYQVVMRYVFNNTPFWTEEVARYIFVWQIWLGTSIGVRERKHIRVELVRELFVRTGRKLQGHILEIMIILVWMAFTAFLTVSGFQLISAQAAQGAVSVGLRLPLQYAYAAIPVGCGVVTVRLAFNLVSEFKDMLKRRIPQ